jgi:hypothetical protein
MTPTLANQLRRLLKGASAIDSTDAVRLANAQRLYVQSVEFEDYAAISKYGSDIHFILRGAAIRLARLAKDSGKLDLFEVLLKWERGVPRDDWPQLIRIVLAPTNFSQVEKEKQAK